MDRNDGSVSRRVRVGSAAAAIGLAMLATTAAAETPRFTGHRVSLVGVAGDYAPVERAIADLESRTGRTCYVVVTQSVGGDGRDATEYAERVKADWIGAVASDGTRFDPDGSALIVAALKDRRVVVLPGRKLVDEDGLTGELIQREMIRDRFLPLARKGDYPGAVLALVRGLEARARTLDKAEPPSAREVATAPAPALPAAAASGPSGRDVLGSVAAVAVVLLGIVALLVWLGRRRARAAFRARLKDYKGKAVAMMDRLDALKARLKSLPIEDGDFALPMTGETFAFYERTQEDLRRQWDRWLEVMDVVDRAERHGEKGAGGVRAGDELVSDSKVFKEAETEADACSAMMDRLNAAHEDARAAAKAAEEARSLATSGVEAVASTGLPIEPYRADAARVAETIRRAADRLVSDPLGSKVESEAAKAEADKLASRAGDVVARREEGVGIEQGLSKLRGDVAARRGEGLRLDEAGGNPDDPAARVDEALAGLRTALEAGDPVAAGSSLAAAAAALGQGRSVLDSVVGARDAVKNGIPEARRESRRLAEALAQYASFQEELSRGFASESWRDVAGNLAQARALLETFEAKADEIEREADPGTQKYLLALRLLGRLNQERRVVFQLMNAVGERLAGLKGVRDQARGLIDEVAALDREIRDFLDRNDAAVGATARDHVRAAIAAREEADRTASAPRVDWPAVLRSLTTARSEYGSARARARTDVDVYRVLNSECDDARREASRVGSFLDGCAEDRPAADRRYRRAVEVLNRVGDDGVRAGNEWSTLLEQVREARRDLEEAERMAREDVRLARQAEAEIDEAARTIREGRAFLSMGIGVDASPAESLLEQARTLHRRQEYEKAGEAAAEAVRQIRRARQAAAEQGEARRMRAEQERRRAAANAEFGGIAAAGIGGTIASGPASSSARHAPERAANPSPTPDAPPGRSDVAEGSW